MESFITKKAMERQRSLTQHRVCVKQVPDHRERCRNSGKQMIGYRQGRGKGERSRGEERRGETWKNDRMGASFPPLSSQRG